MSTAMGAGRAKTKQVKCHITHGPKNTQRTQETPQDQYRLHHLDCTGEPGYGTMDQPGQEQSRRETRSVDQDPGHCEDLQMFIIDTQKL